MKRLAAITILLLLVAIPTALAIPITTQDGFEVLTGKVGLKSDKVEFRSSGGTGVTTLKFADSINTNRTVTMPDPGANASFVMTEGAQTINGVKTLGSAPSVPDGSFARVKLATEAAALHTLNLQSLCRNIDGTVLDATGAATKWKIVAGAFGTGTLELRGNDANTNTVTSDLETVFILPVNYVAGSAITIRLFSHTTGAGTITARTIDAELFKMGTDGTAAGGDLVTTAAQTITGTSAAYDFVVTPTGLVAGDALRLNVRGSVAISDATATRTHLTAARVLIDIKG